MAGADQRGAETSAAWKYNIPVAVVAVLGVALSFGLWDLMQRRIDQAVTAESTKAVDSTAMRAGQSLGELRGTMQAYQSVAGPTPTSASGFRRFARDVTRYNDDVAVMMFAPVVTQAERAAFEAWLRGKGYSETIRAGQTPAAQRDWYLPIRRLYPQGAATSWYGTDLRQMPGLGSGIQVAFDSGKTHIQPLAPNPSDEKPELVALTPVYQGGKPDGMTSAVVPVAAWMDAASAPEDPESTILTLYRNTGDRSEVIWTNATQPFTSAPDTSSSRSVLEVSTDDEYVLAGQPTPALVAAQKPWRPWAVLFAGLLLTAAVCALLWRWLDARRITRTADDLQKATNRLLFLAERDPLTGLPHRDGLLGWLEDWDQRDPDRPLGLLFLDLDGFKDVNTAWGHPTGDLVLRQVGQRLGVFADDRDCTVARLGGDEFVVMRALDRGSLDGLAAMVQTVISEPISVGDQDIQLTSSMGVAVRPEDGRTLDTLLMNADIAVRAAKLEPNDSVVHYDPVMAAQSASHRKMARELRVALRNPNDHFFLLYQPQVDMRTGQVVGSEALVRWRDASGSLVSPAEFIPCAREYGLMGRLGRWVLEEACLTVSAWRRTSEATISVNVDATQLTEGFSAMVGAILQRRHVDPSWLVIELTESAAMQPEATDELDHLRDLGLSISIDDFGTGFSSLSRLADLPTHELKIDRAFVQGLGSSAESLEIVRTVVALAAALDLQTLAEGVETAEQSHMLLAEGVHIAQGFLFSKPIPAEQCSPLWRSGLATPVTRDAGST